MDRDKKIVLELMKSGSAVGHTLAASYGVDDLREVIKELRKDGYQIKTHFTQMGEKKCVRYVLLKRSHRRSAA